MIKASARILRLTAIAFALLTFAGPTAFAQIDGNKYVKVSLLFSHDSVSVTESAQPQRYRVGVKFDIEPGWHIYWRNSGEAAIPTKVEWKLPPGWQASDLHWPMPQRFIERGDIITFGYNKETLLYSDLTAGPLSDGSAAGTVAAQVSWLVCKDICVPGRANLSGLLPLAASEDAAESSHSALFEKYEQLTAQRGANPAAAAIALNPALEKLPLRQGETATAALILENLPANTGLAPHEHIQVFPYRSNGFDFGQARAARDAADLSRIIITLPLDVGQQAALGDHVGEGIVTISKELLGADSDAAVSWRLPFRVADSTAAVEENSALAKALSASGPFAELRFRTSSYLDHQQGEGREPNEGGAAAAAAERTLSLFTALQALLYAFFGGMILNLMPCVLPILSIKVMGFVGASEHSRKEALINSAAYSMGILASFWALAAAVVALQAAGESVAWGFQMQQPQFVLLLTLVVYLLCLGFFDVYNISLPYLQGANRKVSKLSPSLAKHFFDGVLATALSTPCTAPFLGIALVVAFAHGPIFTLAIFTAIGLGLALPYAYLSTHPKLLSKLPKPGPWMYRIRQLMGFLLLGTVLWLLFILHRLTQEGVVWAIALMLLGYFSFWVYDWLHQAGVRRSRKMATVFALFGLIVVFSLAIYPRAVATRTGGSSTSSASDRIAWQPFDKQLLASSVGQGKPVFIDFTADWCITCKANEFLVIETDEVAEAISRYGIVPLKADWTDGNDKITAELKSYGGEGVPYYVVIPGNPEAKAIVLPSLLTTSTLVEAFASAAAEGSPQVAAANHSRD